MLEKCRVLGRANQFIGIIYHHVINGRYRYQLQPNVDIHVYTHLYIYIYTERYYIAITHRHYQRKITDTSQI